MSNSMGQPIGVGEDPVRDLVRQMANATPVLAALTVAISVVFGGSPMLAVWWLGLGTVSLIPAVRRAIPGAGRHVIAAWYGLLALSSALGALNPATFGWAAAVGGLAIGGAHVVSPLRVRWLIRASVVIIQALGLVGVGLTGPQVWFVIGLLSIAVVTESMEAIHRRIEATSERHIEVIAHDHSTLLHLYEIASSIGASTTMHEALPDLLQSIASTVGVRRCGIAIFDADAKRLRLRGPIWANGVALEVEEEIAIEPADGSFAERALRATRAIRFDGRTAGRMRRMSDRMGIESGLLAPIRLEGLVSGVILVGEPISGWFQPEDLAVLTEVAGPVGLVISQVGRYEEAALLAQRMQEVADMKTDLVTMVTHELRTPLTSVIGSIDLLRRIEMANDPELTEDLMSAADRQAHRLKRMIDDLLTVSRFDRGEIGASPEEVELIGAVDEAVWMVDGATVAVEVPDGLSVLADRDHLRQILVNLIENATKFADGAPVQVGADGLDSGDVVLAVIDHGPGIAPEDRGRVFDRFVQLSRGSRPGGSGLGLAIVEMLAEGMGGKVEVFETPGGGATFAVRLPGVRNRRSSRVA